MPRLFGRGELDRIKSTATRESQRRFLTAASNHEEIKLLDSLYDEVFNKSPNGPSELTQLLHEWARHPKRNLDYPWVLAEARDIYFFSITGNPREVKQVGVGFDVFSPAYSGRPFNIPPWVPSEKSERYRRRVLSAFEEYLDDWIAVCKRHRKPFQRRHTRPAEVQHDRYRWTAEHVCLKRGWTEIVEKNGLDIFPQAVSEAVRKILGEIGIPTGKAKPG